MPRNEPAYPALRETIERLREASNRFANGDPEPWRALCSHGDDVTLFGGAGAYELGCDQVGPRYAWASASFSQGRMTSRIIASHVSSALACTVEVEHWEVRMADGGKSATLDLRVTQVYRREDEAWRLIHRHADHLSPKKAMEAIADSSP